MKGKKFHFEATGIGSVPFTDERSACRVIFNNFPAIPFWPQMPKRSFRENMYVQYSERLPGVVIDEAKKTIYVDSSKAVKDLEAVYQRYLDGDTDFFGISPDYAKGLHEFLDTAKAQAKEMRFAKGQVTGPVSFALSVTDENKKAILYDKDLFEAVTKVLSMKARWQIKELKKVCRDVVIFIDEPYLVSIGSSYVNIDAADAMAKLEEVIAAIKKEGALAGIHCCGNTDWPMILKRSIDIVSFDTYNFIKEFALYGEDIKNFVTNNGSIAWGVVPSSDAVDKEDIPHLAERMEGAFAALAKKGIERDVSSLITPSCGVGTMSEAGAERVFDHTRALSEVLAKR